VCVGIDDTGGNNPMIIQAVVQWLSSALRNRKSASVESLR
jgi:hypothetical protein